jgi:hypothetical protein
MSEKADFEPSLKRASHFVKIIVVCPHRLPKLPESTLRKQARPNNGSLFYSHCDIYHVCPWTSGSLYVSKLTTNLPGLPYGYRAADNNLLKPDPPPQQGQQQQQSKM